MAFEWESYTTDELLELRLCDLGLRIEDTWLDGLVHRVLDELAERGISFRPHFWLADEWFSPDHVPGVGVPFYLAHPRLMRLERRLMFEVEGGTRTECLMLLRHEMGHAMQHAFQLQRRRRWQQYFGRASEPYPDYYQPNPRSKRYVVHLDGWYAQAHPAEDFAETFAVWLNPRSRWRETYAGWAARKKLQYVDDLMDELAGARAKVASRKRPYSLPSLRHSLRAHYKRRQDHYSPGYGDEYDRDLLRLFSAAPRHRRNESAGSFLRRHRREIREQVAEWTGEYQFTLDQVLKEMIGRSRMLKLRLARSERATKLSFAIMLTSHTVQLLHRRNEWHPL